MNTEPTDTEPDVLIEANDAHRDGALEPHAGGGEPVTAEELADRILAAGRAVAFIAVGTSGRMTALHYKAWCVRALGRVPDSVRILAFDLDPRTLSVRIDDLGSPDAALTLERDVEDHRIAPDTTFGRLMDAAHADPASHPGLAALLPLMNDGFREIKFETGAGGERLPGFAAWTSWAPNIRQVLMNAFTDIARLHRPGAERGAAERAAVTVFVVGGLAGGTGAATLLPAIKEAIESMDAVGIDVDASFLTEIGVLPEAFPQTQERLATTAATFKDHDFAFTSGRLPGATRVTPPVRKPDLALAVGAATEAGQTLVGIDEVGDVVGLACLMLSLYPLRDTWVAAHSNIGRRTTRRTASGHPMRWGSVGCFAYVFPSRRVASYFSEHVACQVTQHLLRTAAADDGEVSAAFQACHMPDVEALMHNAQLDDDGQPLLGDLAAEVAAAIRGAGGGPQQRLRRLEKIEGAALVRSDAALVVASTVILQMMQTLSATLRQRAQAIEQRDGVLAGLRFAEASRKKLGGFSGALERDRATFKKRLADEEERRLELSTLLSSLGARGWRAGRRFNEALSKYLQASGNALNVGFALHLTDVALAELADPRDEAEHLEVEADGRRVALGEVHAELRRRSERFEKSRPTSVAERHLHRIKELRQLFAEHHETAWDDLPEAMLKRVAGRLGAPHAWPAGGSALTESFLRASSPETSWVQEVTADDYLGWALPVRRLHRESFIRDSLAKAPLLWRYDAASLPEDAGFQNTTFDLVGVPSVEHSTLRATTRAQLIATGDPQRLVFLRLKVGLPWIALWRAGVYEAEYRAVEARGEVALRIYPDYPSHRKGRR